MRGRKIEREREEEGEVGSETKVDISLLKAGIFCSLCFTECQNK
jgi:hypothetical protein